MAGCVFDDLRQNMSQDMLASSLLRCMLASSLLRYAGLLPRSWPPPSESSMRKRFFALFFWFLVSEASDSWSFLVIAL